MVDRDSPDLPRPLTPEEAQAAYDAAEPVPLSEERIREIVEHATKGDPPAPPATDEEVKSMADWASRWKDGTEWPFVSEVATKALRLIARLGASEAAKAVLEACMTIVFQDRDRLRALLRECSEEVLHVVNRGEGDCQEDCLACRIDAALEDDTSE